MSMLSEASLAIKIYRSPLLNKPFDEKKLADIVRHHAAAAAVAAMAAGFVPGTAALIATGIYAGTIWHMYYRIGRYLEMEFNRDVLKALATAVVSNLVTQIGGLFVLDLAGMFVPGISIICAGILNFAVVYIAGLIYFKMLAAVFKKGGDPTTMNAEDLKAACTSAAENVNIKSAYIEAKNTFKEMKKNGDLQKSADKTPPIE